MIDCEGYVTTVIVWTLRVCRIEENESNKTLRRTNLMHVGFYMKIRAEVSTKENETKH